MSAIKSFKPLFDRILIQRIRNVDVKTAGGVFIPEKLANKTNEAIVVEIGTGVRTGNGFATPLLKKGDRVLLDDSRPGQKINVNGIDCEIITEREVLGFLGN